MLMVTAPSALLPWTQIVRQSGDVLDRVIHQIPDGAAKGRFVGIDERIVQSAQLHVDGSRVGVISSTNSVVTPRENVLGAHRLQHGSDKTRPPSAQIEQVFHQAREPARATLQHFVVLLTVGLIRHASVRKQIGELPQRRQGGSKFVRTPTATNSDCRRAALISRASRAR
jgi:hypothetical protein